MHVACVRRSHNRSSSMLYIPPSSSAVIPERLTALELGDTDSRKDDLSGDGLSIFGGKLH